MLLWTNVHFHHMSSISTRWSWGETVYCEKLIWNCTRSSAAAEIAHDAWNGYSRSLKVIRCCANRRGIYDFLLAFNSNLTSIFNRFEISRLSLHLSIPHLSSRNWKKTAESRWTCFGVRVPRTLDYPTINK